MLEEEQDFAVRVTHAAIKSGDAEAIADARVALIGAGLEDHVAFQQLEAAARMLDATRAIDASVGEADRVALVVQAWKRRDHPATIHGLRSLGVVASAPMLDAIAVAIEAANGRRRNELVSVEDVVRLALAVHSGSEDVRRPDDDRRWRKRDTTRSMCALRVQPDDTLLLEVGTETVGSYTSGVRATTTLALALPRATVAEASVAAPLASLPLDLHAQLTELLTSGPSTDAIHRVFDHLAALADGPHADAAVALVQRTVSLWDDALCSPRARVPVETLLGPQARLFRALETTAANLVVAVPRWLADASPALRQIGTLGLCELALDDGAAHTEVLGAFEALHTVQLATELTGLESQLRYPRTVRRVILRTRWGEGGGHFLPGEEPLRRWLDRLATDCDLRRIDVGVGSAASYATLRALPARVELGAFDLAWPNHAAVLARGLGERELARLSLSSWDGVYDELRDSGLPPRVRRLSFETVPGGTAALLATGRWALGALHLRLPLRWARMHRKKPVDYTFTEADVDAIVGASFLGALDTLELDGVLGETLAARLVAGLVQARPKLRRLALNGGEIGNAALVALVEAGLLHDLEELELYRCRLKGNGIASLTHALGPRSLDTLVLARNATTQKPLEQLMAWPGLGSIRRLDLRETGLNPTQLEAVRGSPYLRQEALMLGDSTSW
ncbi:MAG: hypothetical protein NT062_07765 [Proteobacteria bacterium]|nr:hypothetical protein [Pseudomonadota bacterium]